ncbi:MAG TPA: MBL fold metallo-hydrolase [Planctomycetota bacterium]|nr:MBL fold metallo-hydrolase [Planctomycetota bacterium]
MKITFHGAARTVTGSRHLLEVNGQRILLDCGLFQGRREEADRRNRLLGFGPGDVDEVVLSHAHIDHSGAIPALVKNGFKGRIHATPATSDLCDVMLRDSAHIQERDVETVNRREGLTGARAKKPLYTEEDATRAAKRFQDHPYHRPFEVGEGVIATFLDAGHILGAAMVRLDITEQGRRRTLVFSGDLGRDCLPIVRDPEKVDRADILLLESTYGNREHPPIEDIERDLCDLVNRTADRKGKILIPAFAVGRTQQITYLLNNLSAAGRIPPVPVFVDSPLALETTDVFRKHPDCWDPQMVKLLRERNDADPFGFRMLKYIRTSDESKKLNTLEGPAIIISASGMCESGRILHHLANHSQNDRNVILIVGYQAEGTLGRRLVEGETRLRILGREVERRAQVVKMNALSAHAGRGELQTFYRGFKNRVRKLFLVHGEPAQSDAFAAWAKEHSTADVSVPEQGTGVEL